MDYWHEEYCKDVPPIINMREYYALKFLIHDPDTPMYM